MAHIHDDFNGWHGPSELNNGDSDDVERYLLEGVSLTSESREIDVPQTASDGDEDVSLEPQEPDVQGALGLFAEAAQDMATAGLELGLGRHFACADYCNQVAEKATQAVSLLRFGHRTAYDHDLRVLGTQVGAQVTVLEDLERLTPFHPETFYMDTPPEVADEVINAQQANEYIHYARNILRWARSIVLSA
jgi:Uncharacterized conserved protein related to C-terminal domain of eukaryotic chaperone, SACSIN